MKNLLKKFVTSALSMTFMLLAMFPAMPVHAFGTSTGNTPVGDNTAWIRAKLTWQYDGGITGLNDSLLEFSNDAWTKEDGWYYYNIPVNPGDKVRLINGVKIPHEWEDDISDKTFRLIVTVEASEVAPGDTGWNKNKDATFSEDFTVWSQGYKTDEDIWVKEGGIRVRINEYQLDEDGNLETYVNDKVVVPGQFVSKIVEIELDGEKGGNVKLVPEKPVKRVFVGDADVDGKIVDSRTALRYEITVKNPAPDKRTITVYDTVDPRLTVVDAGGAETEKAGKGTKLKWVIQVEGNGTGKVEFQAVPAEGITDEEANAIPNNAEADIVGKRLKSNTVVIGIGPVSAIRMVVTRATGDWGIFGLAAFGVAVLAVIAVIIIILRRKLKDRSEKKV